MWTDGQANRHTERPTDMTNRIANFRNFANAPENDRLSVALAFGTIRRSGVFYIGIYTNVSYKVSFFCSGLFKVGSSKLSHYLFNIGIYVSVYIASHFGNS